MRVSAALIVRDEAAFIEGCLESICGVVDEIIVVDTGSVDDTIERARRFPIQLYNFEWRHDFSAARNFAVAQSTCDWILYIDADERLEVGDREIWRSVIADSRKAGWRLRFSPRVDWTPYLELRLFRNDPRIRFRGVIHERIHDGVEAVCASDGLEVGCCGIELKHVGYEGDVRHKIARNVPLLRDYLANDPSRVYCWWHLGQMLFLDGDDDGAADAWRRGIEAARASSGGGSSDGMSFYSLLLLEHSRGAAIDNLLSEAVALFPGHLALRWLACRHALECGEGERARGQLEEIAAIDPQQFSDLELSYNKKLFSYAAPESLALLHFRAGRFREAAEWYSRAASGAPDPQACEVKGRLAQHLYARRAGINPAA
jgi:tetratricopeptide (TPR) repeat protein